MKNDADWKKHLLASDAALEFLTSRTLVEAGFSTNSSMFSSGMKGDDRPISINAVGFTPFGNPDLITSDVSLHIDCQMRENTAGWLFFPDTNQPDFSEYTLGTTIRAIDEFSVNSLASDLTYEFEERLACAGHGLELGSNSDSDSIRLIDKFLRRFQFSLPQLFTHSINEVAYASAITSVPFFICPILVTNAPLYVANSEVSLDSLQRSKQLEDIAEQVPYLVTYRSIERVFEENCSREFGENLRFDLEYLQQLQSRKVAFGQAQLAPSDIINGLIEGERYLLDKYFSQFIVCNFEHLPSLLNYIKNLVSNTVDDNHPSEIMALH